MTCVLTSSPTPPRQTCADDSKVYLSASSGCTKHEKCSLSTYVNKVRSDNPTSAMNLRPTAHTLAFTDPILSFCPKS